jgi:hypothetical protein
MKAINSVLVRFTREGCEVSVSYTHGSETGAVASPDTKRRALSSTRMAAAGLRTALESR